MRFRLAMYIYRQCSIAGVKLLLSHAKRPSSRQRRPKKILLQMLCVFAFSLSWVGGASAEVCGNDLKLKTQAEIDAVGATGCDSVLGDLKLLGRDSNITNLNGLSNITLVGGGLRILDTDLVNLDGLENIRSVAGYLEIAFNDRLADVSGLRNIRSVELDLRVEYNKFLSSIVGLASLTSVGRDIFIEANIRPHRYCRHERAY